MASTRVLDRLIALVPAILYLAALSLVIGLLAAIPARSQSVPETAPAAAESTATTNAGEPAQSLAVAPDLQREDTFLPQNKRETIASLAVPESAPTVIRQVLPAYPALARLAHLRGMVYARLLVDETGKVGQVGQIRGHAAFREAVKAAARQWEFTPARQGSLAVRAWVTVPFSFEL